MTAIIALLISGHWSAPVPILAKNPLTLRWYATNEYYWVEAAHPQTEDLARTWILPAVQK